MAALPNNAATHKWAAWTSWQLQGMGYDAATADAAVQQYVAGQQVSNPAMAQDLWSMIFSTGAHDKQYLPPGVATPPPVIGSNPEAYQQLATDITSGNRSAATSEAAALGLGQGMTFPNAPAPTAPASTASRTGGPSAHDMSYPGSGPVPGGMVKPGGSPASPGNAQTGYVGQNPSDPYGVSAPSGGSVGGGTIDNSNPNDPVFTATIGGVTSSLDFSTASAIINSALQTVGLDPTAIATVGINAGQTLGNYFWGQIVNQGLTNSSTIGQMIGTLLPSTGQFQVAFPGFQEALKNGYVRTPAEYVSAEEGITAVMLQGGVPKDMINPSTVGHLISMGVSTNEVAQRVVNGLDAAMNAPVEVQNYFAQEFGAGAGNTALATVFLNPNINDVTLQKMFAGAQIRGAAAASNLTISQGLSQRLADMGQTYSSAQQHFQSLTQQAGLFQQTVGEQSSQAPVPGTQNQNQPLTESNQGVQAVFGLDSNALQQVHQAALARQDEFRGGGGAAATTRGEFSGLGEAKSE